GTTTINSSVPVRFLANGNSGPFLVSGQVILGATSIFTVTGNYTLRNGGSTSLSGGRLVFSGASSVLNIQNGGLFSGLGRIEGAVSNAGTLLVGDQGFTGI